jgi:hypothetical protein
VRGENWKNGSNLRVWDKRSEQIIVFLRLDK